MKLLKYIPLQLVLSIIPGILMGYYIPLALKASLLLSLVLLVILAITYIISNKGNLHQGYFKVITFLTFISIGVSAVTLKNSLSYPDHYSNYISNNNNTATLVIREVLKPNQYYDNYKANIITIDSNNVIGNIKLNIQKDSTVITLNIDDKILITSHFDSIQAPLNPYQFDYKSFLEKQQIYHQVSINSNEYLLLQNNRISLKGLAFSIRKKINIALKNSSFKGDELAIINALLLGQRQEISKDIMQNYQNAGAVHILAVSGLHVGIILLMLNFLLKPIEKLKFGIIIKVVLVVSFLWFFAFVAGLSASVVRAVTMFTAVALAMVTKNSINTYKTLIISVFFLLLFNPYYLFDVGFQLSYLAVFFIIWLQPLLYNIWKPRLKAIDYGWQLLTVSIAAQLGVLPLSLYYFHQFPALFFLTNLLVIPFLGFILGFGVVVIMLALLNILPDFIVRMYDYIIFLLNSTVEWVAKQESFLFQNISFTIISVILSYLIIISLFKWMEIKKLNYLKLSLIVVILFQSNLIFEKYVSSSKKEFIVFNKSRHSILGNRSGKQLQLNHTLDSIPLLNESSIRDYSVGSQVKNISENDHIKNIYSFNNKTLLVIDSLGVYPNRSDFSDYVLLRDSPNINLERLIKTISPKLIIADASNFKSYISTWKKTCETYNIKFHYTVTNGAFIEK